MVSGWPFFLYQIFSCRDSFLQEDERINLPLSRCNENIEHKYPNGNRMRSGRGNY